MQWLLWMARSLRFWSSFNGLVKLICNRSRSFTGLFGEAQWYQFPNFQLEGLHRFPLVSTGFRQGSHRSSIPGAGTAARCSVEDRKIVLVITSISRYYQFIIYIYPIYLSMSGFEFQISCQITEFWICRCPWRWPDQLVDGATCKARSSDGTILPAVCPGATEPSPQETHFSDEKRGFFVVNHHTRW